MLKIPGGNVGNFFKIVVLTIWQNYTSIVYE